MGTVFGVARLPSDDAAVEVVEGVVRVTSDAGSSELAVGTAWPPESRAIQATAAELLLLDSRCLFPRDQTFETTLTVNAKP